MSHGTSSHGEGPCLTHITSVSTLLSNIEEIRRKTKWKSEADKLQYYRGQNKKCYNLNSSVMRHVNHDKNEGNMLRDLIARQPDEFSKFASALDHWMLAQHHGLCTRFLDISMNPLVGLYFACGDDTDKGDTPGPGVLYVFSTTRDRVKPYDSDSVSIVANFARLRKCEQKAILKNTEEYLSKQCAFVDQCRRIMTGTDGKHIKKKVKDYDDHMNSLRQENEAAGRYSVMGRLYTFVKQEKPYFEDLIDPRDLFRIFIVQPRLLFPRVRAQSGAFLVSAYHKTFDFESKECHERNIQYQPDNYDVPYNYYRLTVPACKKQSIRKELESLNISRETLFPELSESAKAIVKNYKTKNVSA